MSELTFEIHTVNGEVSSYVFRKAVDDALYLVSQYDAGISKTRTGVYDWFVNGLHNNGTMAIDFVSRLKKSQRKSKLPERVESQKITDSLMTGVDDIENRGVTPSYLSENGLERVGELADLLQREPTTNKFSFKTPERIVEITPQTSENVKKLLPIKRTAFGSVEGRIEVINVHKRFKALLYHAVTNKIITCYFEESEMDMVKDALGKRVIVSGELKKNIHGDTFRIEKPQLEIMEGKKRFVLPNKNETLKTPSFANAFTTAEYMRRIRGG